MPGVPGLRRGLAILRLLAEGEPLTAATLAARLDLPRSTTYHLLTELEAAGVVAHLPDTARWAIGIGAFEVGTAYLRHHPLDEVAGPSLRRLAHRVGHDVHLGVLDGRELLYLVRERPPRPQTLVTAVGVRLPAHLTASGRAVLAGLAPAQRRALLAGAGPLARRTDRGPTSLRALTAVLAAEARRGWSVEDGEVSRGYASVARAIRGADGQAIAAISVTFPHQCAPQCHTDFADLAAVVGRTADEITRHLGGVREWGRPGSGSP